MIPMLVLSLFPGIGLLDKAFEDEGFCIVRGPDVIWGGDVRKFHPPQGKFNGIIGGPPCQTFSRLAHMIKQNGLQPTFGNLIPEFERCIDEALPDWFLMENVPDAPVPSVRGYGIGSWLLNNRELGEIASRERRFSFGFKGEFRALKVDTIALHNALFEYAATGGSARPVAINGSRKPKKFRDGKGRMPWNAKGWEAAKELCRKQGLEETFIDHFPFTAEATCKALGNGVSLPMGRAIARAIKETVA